jgi:hypothetical protein
MFKTLIPLIVSIVALVFTGCGSWSCQYFAGATISFTSAHYGLWTLQDASGKCQLWDQLFFAYDLGPMLRTARFFSMVAQLDGLALTAVLSQALQFHACSWSMFLALFFLFLTSMFASGLFNLWTFFFLFTYVIFTLIVRFLIVHPVPRRISERGCRIISWNCGLCSMMSFLTLIVLKSNYCTCEDISSKTLEGRNPGMPCGGLCSLRVAGYLTICAGFLWGTTAIAVLKCGVQPKVKQNGETLQTNVYHPRRAISSHIVITAGTGSFKDATTAKGRAIAETTEKAIQSSLSKSASVSFDDNSNHGNALEALFNNNGSSGTEGDGASNPLGDNDLARAEAVDEEKNIRSRCKKICFDYRVTPRTRKEQCMYWSFRMLLLFFLVIYAFFIVLMLGSFKENFDAALAPDTSYNFILNDVCAFNSLDSKEPFISYTSKQDALDAGYIVAHCGKCGHCSNPFDIRQYVETRKTIARTAKKCGVYAVFGTYDELTACLEERIGFTHLCTECWTDNMISTASRCLFTCMKAMFTETATTNNVKGTGKKTVWLNQCIYCDEKMSGPAFVQCSGVARRRLGVVSEIERNPAEQCRNTDIDWVNTNFTELFPNLTKSID